MNQRFSPAAGDITAPAAAAALAPAAAQKAVVTLVSFIYPIFKWPSPFLLHFLIPHFYSFFEKRSHFPPEFDL